MCNVCYFHCFSDGVKVFSEFLRSEYSEENIKFWLACENFKSLKGNKFRKSAQKIYQLFIEVCSASEVCLSLLPFFRCYCLESCCLDIRVCSLL